MSALRSCEFCGSQPGAKVGPPALVRCITVNCKGSLRAAVTVAEWNSTPKHRAMREAINAVELALNNLEIDSIARQWQGADDSVVIKVPLGALRRLAKCYPELNRIINDPEFEHG